MPAFIDARQVPDGTILDADLAIIGGGPAGISLALALANAPIRVVLLESGGEDFDGATQALYAGEQTGVQYLSLDGSRLRYLGGSTNHWGGWTRPLDVSDFAARDWLAHSGWPFGRDVLEPYLKRAQGVIEAGPWIFDDTKKWSAALGAPLPLGDGGVYTSFFQFSQWTGNDQHLPTHFGARYADELKRAANLKLLLNANVTGLRLAADAASLDSLDVATLSGRRFTVKPRHIVLACGGMENARMLLASRDVVAAGVGNANDLVGRFFADHAIPRDCATLVVFDGTLAPYYPAARDALGAHVRATFAPTEAFKSGHRVLGSLSTVEQTLELDALGRAAVAATASALGVEHGDAKAFSLGTGLELAPDPERRLTLTDTRDALGIPRLKLHMTISDGDFASYRETIREMGRQLILAKSGLIRLNHRSRADWLAAMDWGNHHMGTTRMHDDPKQGVVDANSRVHGIGNLFVAGSSVFPTYGASNPTLNLVALTLRLADHVKGLFA